MSYHSVARIVLAQEARALLTRLDRVKPFSLHMPMVPAAAISPMAQSTLERFMVAGRRELRQRANQFLNWLYSPEGRRAPPIDAQRRFTFLRLRFNAILTEFDIFADVLNQRSEHENGIWIAGLDVAAADVLTLPGNYYNVPPMICYLDRGIGAAIRRVRTRLPGGRKNPVAIIRVPRERMIGSGVASSLAHEVGHQGSALLDLVNSLRREIHEIRKQTGKEEIAWQLWERWISEIIADFWSVAKVGIASTMGLIGVVSLPRPFVFRVNLSDPHPIPWIRVILSSAIGRALFPHQQWDDLTNLWTSFYPLAGLDKERWRLFNLLKKTMPNFIHLLVNHRPKALKGKSLIEAMVVEERQPECLGAYYQRWQNFPTEMRDTPPSLALAVIGQAKADGKMSPEDESQALASLLTYWALHSTIDIKTICAKNADVKL